MTGDVQPPGSGGGPPEALREAAAAVLRGNDAGGWTKPSPGQYPHQWNWDSALISLGWSWLDWDRACVEVESMLQAQWRDGMVPHIRYDPERIEGYFPGPDRWPGAQGRAASGALTSGISNPPVLVSAALLIARRQPDPARRRNFLDRVYDPLAAWLRYFQSSRTLDGSPLVAVVHPWETGWDNSPRWDLLKSAALKPRTPFVRRDRLHVAAAQRPGDRDYDSYLALAEILDGSGYDLAVYRDRSPFLVNDVLFDALWYRAARDLAEIAAELGRPAAFGPSELEAFATAFEERHWDPGMRSYLDYDVLAARRIEVETPAGIASAISGLVPADRLRVMWQAYRGRQPAMRPLWTVSPARPEFDPVLYWRGPVWVNVNWICIRGLLECGLVAEARELSESTLRLVEQAGFWENFNPLDGAGTGAGSFSWTAALTLELLNDPP